MLTSILRARTITSIALLLLASSALEASPVVLRLEPATTVVAPGDAFTIDVYVGNPLFGELGGYQIAIAYDASRYVLCDDAVLCPNGLPAPVDGLSVLADTFDWNAPPPAGVGFPNCPDWDDGVGDDVVTAVGFDLSTFSGFSGHLFRMTFQAIGDPNGVPDSFTILSDVDVCGWLGSEVVDGQGLLQLPVTYIGSEALISDVLPPTNLQCTAGTTSVSLTWDDGDVYDAVRIYRDDVQIDELAGDATSTTDDTVTSGTTYEYRVAGVVAGVESPAPTCTVTTGSGGLPAPEGLNCAVQTGTVNLTWTNPAAYTTLQVQRNGTTIATLLGTAQSYTDGAPVAGTSTYEVIGLSGMQQSAPASCQVDFNLPTFIRGDANLSGAIDLSDATSILSYLFAGGSPVCEDAGDVDDDGSLVVSDPIYLLSYLFSSGPPPAPPFPNAGTDPTADSLGCSIP